MMGMLALILMPQMKQVLDEQKVLKMILIHDLAEALTTDIPVWQGVQSKEEKSAAEKEAITHILGSLDSQTGQDLLKIWEEYEERQSPEAQFVKALDTLDVITQHNVSPIESWDDNDYLWQLSPLQNAFFDFDPFLRQIKDEIDAWSIKKVEQVGMLHKLDQAELKKKKPSHPTPGEKGLAVQGNAG
jgi:putative hydrolase of HD superfamily